MQDFIKKSSVGRGVSIGRKYMRERTEKLKTHDGKIQEYRTQRLEEIHFREKDKINLEISRLSQYDPAKYLPPFEHGKIPYLAELTINDDDPEIGSKHLLFGKQGLTDGSNVVVDDWRKADISCLYYEWDEGEDYEEDIAGRERTGVSECKISYGIRYRELLSIKSAKLDLQKGSGNWQESKQVNASMDTKEKSGDYRMTDIVSLISREQFALISGKIKGCLYLSDGAGCGKTTVALHRLSYLLFNEPELFRLQRSGGHV